ncbi:GDYXXLXY domain-containing protein [Paenibacillus eucommiae]|uniref:Membrane-anchored protein n=1 Tax=Paenibacillus eucommiae TaxID=1355755 RepID=A0ABS4J7Q1_9BACL|nr:GDYXXLXY domain-containing protein [Paenibacillus eucommiae]MBP1995853.1 putative membrane-anchored protein [Paenibacillus eucommiae]
MTKPTTDLQAGSTFWKLHRTKLLVVLVILQVLFLLGTAGSSYAVRWLGKEIRLQTLPVDPRDLLYGDYVILNYEISTLPTSLLNKGEFPERGDTVYVLLKLNASDKAGTYDAVGIYTSKPSAAAEEAIIKARVEFNHGDTLRLEYGLEKYYVPENTGKELENQVGELVARVKVAPWSRAVIEGLEPK